MNAWLALGAAALVSGAVAAWWYGWREERVRGRGPAAVLRGLALFLLLSGAWMPRFGSSPEAAPTSAILIDVSASMRLPLGEAGGRSRFEAARAAVDTLLTGREARLWSFGAGAEPVERETLASVAPSAAGSSVVGAIELARAAGADTLFVVTDGELTDRESARRLAVRLGVGLREVRVAGDVGTIGVRSLEAPRTVAMGDSLSVRVELVARGSAGEPVGVRVALAGDTSETATVLLPAAGRASAADFTVPVRASSDTAEWRPLDVIVESPSGIPAPTDIRRWVRVTPDPAGAVLVSLHPDWEPRFLAPVLERSVPGGARVFLRTGEGSWVDVSPRPAGGIAEERVRRAAASAAMLWIQGDPAAMPGWLRAAAANRPAVLYLARGAGPLPGTDLSVDGGAPGDWYVSSPPPAGPVAAQLAGMVESDLPPLSPVRGVEGPGRSPVLEARRDRQGAARPIVVLASAAERRAAAVLAEGTWRWAARGGDGRAAYRTMYSSLVRWLGDRAASVPVQLSDASPRAGDSLRWRVAPEVRDLVIRVDDAGGEPVWTGESAADGNAPAGAPMSTGEARYTATGRVGDRPFRVSAPFYIAAGREDIPGPMGPALDVSASGVGTGSLPGSDPPVWPFALSLALLCAEWVWRRKVGLR